MSSSQKQLTPFPCHASSHHFTARSQQARNIAHFVPALRTLGVPVHPILRILVKGRPVALELVRNTRLDCVIRLGSREDCPDQREHILNLVWRLPLVRTQHAQAHSASVVIRHIWVVYLGFEADARWLEGVVFGESHVDLEVAALFGLSVLPEVCEKVMLSVLRRPSRLGLAL